MKISFLHAEFLINFVEAIINKHEHIIYLLIPSLENTANTDEILYTRYKLLPEILTRDYSIRDYITYLLSKHNYASDEKIFRVMLYSETDIKLEVESLNYLKNFANPILHKDPKFEITAKTTRYGYKYIVQFLMIKK